MNFAEFERIISHKRMERYLAATANRKRRAMKLYNGNVCLAKETYVVINYFEVALRNAIDNRLSADLGCDWLRDSVLPGGVFDNVRCEKMCKIIRKRYNSLMADGDYTHTKLLSSLEFGVWKYMFADYQYRTTGRVLLDIFPSRPSSRMYNNTYFFNELHHINILRNRIAHQEPICFSHQTRLIDTQYIRAQHRRILRLFSYMGINSKNLLSGMDHVEEACKEIESI